MIVVGAGVLGLASAAELAERGHAVTVIDPGGPNASSIAAGMIAPALECLIEDASTAHAGLMVRAASLWPGFADRHRITLHREGAEWRGLDPEADAARLERLGFVVERRSAGVFIASEQRVDADPSLLAVARRPNVSLMTAEAADLALSGGAWRVTTREGETLSAARVVLATGVSEPVLGLPLAARGLLRRIAPIKGQITWSPTAPPPCIVRSPTAYVVRAGEGLLFGATMAYGARDAEIDLDAVEWQRAEAERLLGRPVAPGVTRVGVRGATPDDLPMAGGAGSTGLFLAVAPRRNGWLLAPLVARTVADAVEGRAPSPDAAALDPLRFA